MAWLGVCSWNQTFDEDEAFDVEQIRELLDKEDIAITE